MNHFAAARQAEIAYQEALCEETELFQEGTRLSRPVSSVLELLSLLDPRGLLGVDLLPIAVSKMLQYAEQTIQLLQDYFQDWEIIRQGYKLQSIEEQKAGRTVIFQNNGLTFAARKGIVTSYTSVRNTYSLST